MGLARGCVVPGETVMSVADVRAWRDTPRVRLDSDFASWKLMSVCGSTIARALRATPMSDLLSHFDSQIQNQEQMLREREQEIEELRRQRDRLAELTQQRDELHAQLRAIESDIALVERTMTSSLHRFANRFESLSSSSVPPPAPAPAIAARITEPPATTLKDEIKKVLRAARGPLSGHEIADRVKAGGYKTSSANFANIVKKHLTEMSDVTYVRGEGYKLRK